MMVVTHKLRRIGIVLFVLAIASYGIFQARDLLEGPAIYLENPKDGTVLNESFIAITGRAENISEITLNDRHIFVDETGHFAEQLLLPEGYTIMTLEARDRFGRTTTETLRLVRTK